MTDKKGSQFREDLYYRIAQGIVKLPPLRDMKDSIPELSNFLIGKMKRKLLLEKDFNLTPRAVKKLQGYDWPGNIRELENVLYRTLKRIDLEGETELRFDHIEELSSAKGKASLKDEIFSGKTYDKVEGDYVRYVYERAKGNQSEMMRQFGFNSRSPVRKLLKKHELIEK